MPDRRTEGLLKACRYSFVTNRMDYCGTTGAHRQFEKFLLQPTPGGAGDIEKIFPSFQGLYPYLKLIAQANNLGPLDPEVAEAYWMGSPLLEKVRCTDLQKMIREEFSKPGLLPPALAEKKASGIPDGVLPHHSFHVLYVNFVTKKVEPILENLDKCLVGWGNVKEEGKDALRIRGIRLCFGKGQFRLEEREKEIARGLAGEAIPGDWVSVHWDFAVERISKAQLECLQHATLQNLRAVNAALPAAP